MKKTLSILMILLLAVTAWGGEYHNKLGSGLKRMLLKPAAKASMQPLPVFVAGDQAGLWVRQYGGTVETDLGDLVTARLSLSAIEALAQEEAVSRIRLGRRMKKYNDQAAASTGANVVRNGGAPLSRAYTGENVVVGIIDTGLDLDHEDFYKADGSSRVLWLWDQAASGSHPTGYSYGAEWTQAQINSGAATHEDLDGHGTHVTGSAAGNGRAVGAHTGMAPKADIIMVALDFGSSTGVVDAANYIYSKAAALGRPCVINASLGSHGGPHDGSSLESRMLDQLITSRPGQAFCAAAGNEGMDGIHVGVGSASEQFTYFNATDDWGEIWLYIRVPNSLLSTVEFKVGADESDFNPMTGEGGYLADGPETSWYTPNGMGNGRQEDLGADVGTVFLATEAISDSMTAVFIQIADDLDWDWDAAEADRLDLWRLHIRGGTGRIHGWVADAGMSYPGQVGDASYRYTDFSYSVGMPAVARQVIAVGASVNRTQWTSIDGYTYGWGDGSTVGDIADFSSRGPTADERIKPEIVAPGHGVISALSAPSADEWGEESIVSGEEHVISSGTSMASPVAAGIVALLLEKDPSLTAGGIMAALKNTAKKDGFTGNSLPDNTWGWGKIDALALVSSTAVDDDDLLPRDFALSAAYPNPFNPVTALDVSVPTGQKAVLTVFDISGRQIETWALDLKFGRQTVMLDGSGWPSGIYMVRMKAGNEVRTQKIALVK